MSRIEAAYKFQPIEDREGTRKYIVAKIIKAVKMKYRGCRCHEEGIVEGLEIKIVQGVKR